MLLIGGGYGKVTGMLLIGVGLDKVTGMLFMTTEVGVGWIGYSYGYVDHRGGGGG